MIERPPEQPTPPVEKTEPGAEQAAALRQLAEQASRALDEVEEIRQQRVRLGERGDSEVRQKILSDFNDMRREARLFLEKGEADIKKLPATSNITEVLEVFQKLRERYVRALSNEEAKPVISPYRQKVDKTKFAGTTGQDALKTLNELERLDKERQGRVLMPETPEEIPNPLSRDALVIEGPIPGVPETETPPAITAKTEKAPVTLDTLKQSDKNLIPLVLAQFTRYNDSGKNSLEIGDVAKGAGVGTGRLQKTIMKAMVSGGLLKTTQFGTYEITDEGKKAATEQFKLEVKGESEKKEEPPAVPPVVESAPEPETPPVAVGAGEGNETPPPPAPPASPEGPEQPEEERVTAAELVPEEQLPEGQRKNKDIIGNIFNARNAILEIVHQYDPRKADNDGGLDLETRIRSFEILEDIVQNGGALIANQDGMPLSQRAKDIFVEIDRMVGRDTVEDAIDLKKMVNDLSGELRAGYKKFYIWDPQKKKEEAAAAVITVAAPEPVAPAAVAPAPVVQKKEAPVPLEVAVGPNGAFTAEMSQALSNDVFKKFFDEFDAARNPGDAFDLAVSGERMEKMQERFERSMEAYALWRRGVTEGKQFLNEKLAADMGVVPPQEDFAAFEQEMRQRVLENPKSVSKLLNSIEEYRESQNAIPEKETQLEILGGREAIAAKVAELEAAQNRLGLDSDLLRRQVDQFYTQGSRQVELRYATPTWRDRLRQFAQAVPIDAFRKPASPLERAGIASREALEAGIATTGAEAKNALSRFKTVERELLQTKQALVAARSALQAANQLERFKQMRQEVFMNNLAFKGLAEKTAKAARAQVLGTISDAPLTPQTAREAQTAFDRMTSFLGDRAAYAQVPGLSTSEASPEGSLVAQVDEEINAAVRKVITEALKDFKPKTGAETAKLKETLREFAKASPRTLAVAGEVAESLKKKNPRKAVILQAMIMELRA